MDLIGEYEGSGYKEPPSLVRRADGQVLQLPPLLYSLAAKADGQRSVTQIAEQVGAEIHRGLDGSQVQFLVEEKLRPLGVLAAADGTSPTAKKKDPFLALRFRASVISERTSNVLGATFKPLFVAPVMVVALAGFIAGDIWLFFEHGVSQALRQSIEHPGFFLPLFAAIVISAAFHEIGHAAACRYGGGHPGKMGCGLYLAFPAFYTDVTDAYRLGKRARLRTDLGGIYFNVMVVLATLGSYFVTHFEPLLLLVILEHIEIVHQLLPVIRLDGYYIVADLTGVPDLFARIGPILRSLVPGHEPDERVTLLKPWVRRAVTAWVLVVVPLLAVELLIVLIHLPRILGTAWSSGSSLWHKASHGLSTGNPIMGITDLLQILVLAIPIAGILLMLVSTAKRGGVFLWKRTDGRPVVRGVGLVAAAGALVLLGMAWLPSRNYHPIQRGDRGTFAAGFGDFHRFITLSGPLYQEPVVEHRTGTPVQAPRVPSTGRASGGSAATTTTVAHGSEPNSTTTDERQRGGGTTTATTSSGGSQVTGNTTTTITGVGSGAGGVTVTTPPMPLPRAPTPSAQTTSTTGGATGGATGGTHPTTVP
ncbi:MAG: hypothetical protein M3137_19995 [Actinomycetota bacterium]|nr:hypothetical protein [Actinomycetota bacterium]